MSVTEIRTEALSMPAAHETAASGAHRPSLGAGGAHTSCSHSREGVLLNKEKDCDSVRL